MKKMLVFALAAALFMSPLMTTAQAVEPVRGQTALKEEVPSGPRGRRPHRRGRRHSRGDSTGAWVAAGIVGAAIIGGAIASSKNKHSSPTYVYEQPPTYIYEQAPTYVYEQPSTVIVQPGPTYVVPSTPTYVYPQGATVVDPTVYTYDQNGNLVPYYGQ